MLTLLVAVLVLVIANLAATVTLGKAIMSELDQVLAADTATLTAVQGVAAQLTTDVNALITLIVNGDPGALAAAQAIGSSLTSLQTSLQSLDTAAQGAEGAPPAAKPVTPPAT